MNHEAAHKLLKIAQGASSAEIEAAWRQRQDDILGQLKQAHDSAERQRHTSELDALQSARDLLLTGTPAGKDREIYIDAAASGLKPSEYRDVGVSSSYFDPGKTQPGIPGLKVGTVLSNRFELIECIGSGGMGMVYRAHDRNRAVDIALKVMQPELLGSETARQRFRNEARIAIELSHQHIVKTYDELRDGDYLFLTMELLKGRSLRAEMIRREQAGQKWDVGEVMEIASTICQALSYAHKKTIHRDIKPENIWLDQEGQVKLMDFGIAKLMNTSQITQTAAVMGSREYMAPEHLKSAKHVDHRADQYSIGIMLYELLAGNTPSLKFKSLHQLRKDVSPALSVAIEKAFEGKPEERFENCAVFAERLKAASVTKQESGFRQYLLPVAAIGGVLLVAGIWVMKPKDTPLPPAPAPMVVTPQPDPPKVPEAARVKPLAVQPKAEPVKVVEAAAIKELPKTIEAPKPVEAKPAKPLQLAVPNVNLPEMVRIPGRNYEMGKYHVTKKEWREVMGSNPSHFTNCGDTCPVEQVSWDDIQTFLQKLNARTGRQYRLPTEAEWEYACYGGSQTEYCGGNDINAVAWYDKNSDDKTHPVGQKQANGYGLYDMSGNLWQWMENKYDNEHDWRALRGGSWGGEPQNARAASRDIIEPAIRNYYIGFRLARTLP